MKFKEITVSTRFVKNLGNYQSLSLEASITSQVEDGDNIETVFASSWEMAKSEIKKQLKDQEGGK